MAILTNFSSIIITAIITITMILKAIIAIIIDINNKNIVILKYLEVFWLSIYIIKE